ncbi:MAG: hypothetical protein J6S14_04855 [Clostridia bacterium]|nr:hypothetical protein [Clostridia bacterium]
MSTYTKNEIMLIEEATSVANRYVTIAQNLLMNFFERYFENISDHKILANEAMYRPEMISSQIDAILHVLEEGKRELDVFSNPDELEGFLSLVEEKKNIIKTYTEENNGKPKIAG